MKLHEAQWNAILPSLKSKYLIFKLASTVSSGFLLLPASHDGSGLTFFVHRRKLNHYPGLILFREYRLFVVLEVM